MDRAFVLRRFATDLSCLTYSYLRVAGQKECAGGKKFPPSSLVSKYFAFVAMQGSVIVLAVLRVDSQFESCSQACLRANSQCVGRAMMCSRT